MLDTIKSIIDASIVAPRAPACHYGTTESAAQHNHKVLASHDYNLKYALDCEKGTTIPYGSELRDADLLEKLF